MTKNIIFCADGTWNHPDEDENGDGLTDPSNVYRLYGNLARSTNASNAKEQECSTQGQIAKYIHGVGDDSNWLAHFLDGALGIGVVARIVRGYTFISRNYQPGDRIYLIGFSRGSYTVRALAGMIVKQGLLKPDILGDAGSETSYRKGAAAWERYCKANIHKSVLAKVESFITHIGDNLFGDSVSDADFVTSIPVQAVAVWDTVGALGIPVHNARGECIDVFNFTDTELNHNVTHGFHAVSRDEQRAGFSPTLWNIRGGIEQLVFPGCHADIGGGYAEHGLSDITLQWMTEHLARIGVLFSPKADYAPHPDPSDKAHQEWKLNPAWGIFGTMRRRLDGVKEHSSVSERKQAATVQALPDPPQPYY